MVYDDDISLLSIKTYALSPCFTHVSDCEWELIREAINRVGVFGNNRFKKQIEEAIGRKIIIRGKGRPKKE